MNVLVIESQPQETTVNVMSDVPVATLPEPCAMASEARTVGETGIAGAIGDW